MHANKDDALKSSGPCSCSCKCSGGVAVATIFARNYGTAAVISYNLKGIAPPVPPVQCWIDKNLMSAWLRGANVETGGGREGGKNVSVNGILQPIACEN